MVFFHIDLDAFFASVEILDHPEYKGKPLIIGSRSERSVVSTCSYEASSASVLLHEYLTEEMPVA